MANLYLLDFQILVLCFHLLRYQLDEQDLKKEEEEDLKTTFNL